MSKQEKHSINLSHKNISLDLNNSQDVKNIDQVLSEAINAKKDKAELIEILKSTSMKYLKRLQEDGLIEDSGGKDVVPIYDPRVTPKAINFYEQGGYSSLIKDHDSLNKKDRMPEYYIKHREVFSKPYLKVELKDNSNLTEVRTILEQLQSIKNVNITENKRTDLTVYPSKFFSPKETEEEVKVQLDSYFNSQPLDPIFDKEKLSTISHQAYEQILREIEIFGRNLEKLKSLHSKFDEEGFRDFFIPHLNSISFNHSASGETFNKIGKSDILIQDKEGVNVFIAECKIWHGEKELQKALDQLIERYVSWRDEHTALIIFNKDNDKFTQLVDTAKIAMESHPNCIKKIKDTSDTSSRFQFRNAEDPDKTIQIELTIFNCN